MKLVIITITMTYENGNYMELYHLLSGLSTVHKSFWNQVRCEDFVSRKDSFNSVMDAILREQYVAKAIRRLAVRTVNTTQEITVLNKNRNIASPLFEFLECDPVGKTLTTNTDSFKHTITFQLIQNQMRVDLPGLKRIF